MAITRAQQFRQMLEDGGMLVQPGFGGTRQGYRSAKAQEVQGRTKASTTKPGTSGGSTAKDDDVAPGYNPKTGRFEKDDGTPERARTFEEVKQSLDAATAQGRFKKKNPVKRFIEQYTGNTRKALYNTFPNNPRNELDYLRSLPDSQKALLSPALRAKLEELEDAERFDDIDSVYDTKFTFNEFEDLRKFQPTDDTLNFAEYAAKFKGAPGLLYSGDVGGLIKIKNPDGTFRYERRSDDDGPSGESDLDRRLRLLEEQNAALRDQAAAAGGVGTSPLFRLMADGGMTDDAPIEGGIMDLESAREMMFLGGIVKGLKKIGKSATRAIKKVAKSPIGKAALLGIGGSFALGLGPFASGSTMFGGKLAGLKGSGFLKSAGLKDFFIKDGALTGKGISTLLLGAPFIGDILNLNKPKEEPDLYAGPKLDFNAQIYNRLMADGGKAEPVAKKTMPLLDLDGQEMDLRDNGGFVPIGRMEKADDVPARLSKNEFVFTADAVRNAGGGDVDKGAEVMYNTMKNLEAGGEMSDESQGLDGARNMFQTSQRLGEVI